MSKPKATLTLEDKDLGWEKIKEELQKAEGGAFAKIGYLGLPEDDRRDDGPLGNVAIALIHEFGAPSVGIPERSHLRASFDRHRSEYEALLARMAKALYSGKATMEQVVSIVGLRAANDVKAFIREGVPPPNAPSVALRKSLLGKAGGAIKTLINSGRMLASLDFEAVIRGFQVVDKAKKEPKPGPTLKDLEKKAERAKVGRIHHPRKKG